MSFKDFWKGCKEGFANFGHDIANIVNFILLLFVYITAIAPTKLVAKLFGKQFLDLGQDNKASNWVKNKITKQPYESYLRRF
ncbi:MAG: hypothetical protein QF632_07040 [Candidatus Woesearchaeota archaeon]|jgi:hypothetical protein|nr:hypothetical protein [Candidatus Woesearchaeota archaeon]MDP7324490.1 hypothetical protein [Candidatus Woesearchaeota archaeon]MDP7458274.1 hypothetical protein [Candidatus Woesearchaeota archaeon]|tara:strand:+ start:105 stop:350 length:246 start_codon:yes stop_codon:yes gene_type:complete